MYENENSKSLKWREGGESHKTFITSVPERENLLMPLRGEHIVLRLWAVESQKLTYEKNSMKSQRERKGFGLVTS